ncbi:MAG: TA system VapC family ribonuclease toxin [Bryobacteraceae bacterium]
MILLDVNILLYASNRAAPQHRAMKNWLNKLFSESELIGLTWPTIWAFLRIASDRRLRILPTASSSEAFGVVNEWLAQPGVLLVEPGRRHLQILERCVIDGQAGGPMLSDAVLAALAIENSATLASTDKDFSRFSGLRWINPLQ